MIMIIIITTTLILTLILTVKQKEKDLKHGNKIFLDLKQQELAKEFLQKYADNDNLYILKNIYEQPGKETFILLNFPQDKQAFNNFIQSTYKPFLTS
jgi:hypothetical protein